MPDASYLPQSVQFAQFPVFKLDACKPLRL